VWQCMAAHYRVSNEKCRKRKVMETKVHVRLRGCYFHRVAEIHNHAVLARCFRGGFGARFMWASAMRLTRSMNWSMPRSQPGLDRERGGYWMGESFRITY
jgi:hypothetical protein